MDFLQTNWVWLVLVVGIVWLLSRGRLGCGMGRRHVDRTRRADVGPASRELGRRDRPSGEAGPREESAGHRRHRGC
jgi:hypothetical protein